MQAGPRWWGVFQAMITSSDFHLNAVGSHWKILSREVIRTGLCFHKMFQNSGPRCHEVGG